MKTIFISLFCLGLNVFASAQRANSTDTYTRFSPVRCMQNTIKCDTVWIVDFTLICTPGIPANVGENEHAAFRSHRNTLPNSCVSSNLLNTCCSLYQSCESPIGIEIPQITNYPESLHRYTDWPKPKYRILTTIITYGPG